MYAELPELMPSEHLLSAVARWFDTSGHTCFATATKKYVSSNVNKLNPLTIWRPIYFDLAKHYIGTTGREKLIELHTLIPYYWPFIRPTKRALLDSRNLLKNRNIKITFTLQKNLKNGNEWRWCNYCVRDDLEKYGFRYWHTYHQLPSMLNCYIHNTALQSICRKCGFKYDRLDKHWLPPINGVCPECGKIIDNLLLSKDRIIPWLDLFSIALQQDKARFTYETIIKNLRKNLFLETYFIELPAFQEELIRNLRKYSHEWLNLHTLKEYFNTPGSTLSEFHETFLDVAKTAFAGKIFPPLNMMLMMKLVMKENTIALLINSDE